MDGIMRLKVSRPSAEEELIRLINAGYEMRRCLWSEYDDLKRERNSIHLIDSDMEGFYSQVNKWFHLAQSALRAIFPTTLELNYFVDRAPGNSYYYTSTDRKFGHLYYDVVSSYIERLKTILEVDLPRYTDLPVQDRLFVEDIDSFQKVRDVNPAMVAGFLRNGLLDRTEDQVQLALEQILAVTFHRMDWGGETNDLYTANVMINGTRRATAFLLKGPGIQKKEMTIANCGKNGDQIVRLFTAPADLFVVQYVGPIADMVVRDTQGKVSELRSKGREVHFLIMEGQDTARLVYAYGKL